MLFTSLHTYDPPITDLSAIYVGNVYIADSSNFCVRKVTVSTGIISTIAGIGEYYGNSGDNGPATLAEIGSPYGVVVDASGKTHPYH